MTPSESGASVEIEDGSSDHCIFRTPFPELDFQEPQLASIGPYHHGKNLPLEKYKYSILEKFVSRSQTRNQGKDLSFYIRHVMKLEWCARRCYADDLPIRSPEFVEMMLVDGCFIMEVLRNFCSRSEEGFFPIEPWQIPILVQDLLMLENQIPFFVLQKLFDLSEESEEEEGISLSAMALKFIDLAFPRSMDFSFKSNHSEANHLLDLFLDSIRPSNPSAFTKSVPWKDLFIPNPVYSFFKKINMRIAMDQESMSSHMSSEPSISEREQVEQEEWLIDSATDLRTISNIKLRPPRRGDERRFTDINFKNGVLEIPPVTIDDLFVSILINCVAFEQRSKRSSKDLTAYVSFMSSLIRHPSDVELLCSNGIISIFSHDEIEVAKIFNISLSFNLSDIGNPDSYLSDSVVEIQRHCTRHENGTRSRWWHRFRISWLIFSVSIKNITLISVVDSVTHLAEELALLGASNLHHFLFINLIILMILVGSNPVSNFQNPGRSFLLSLLTYELDPSHYKSQSSDGKKLKQKEPITTKESQSPEASIEGAYISQYSTPELAHKERLEILDVYNKLKDIIGLYSDEG